MIVLQISAVLIFMALPYLVFAFIAFVSRKDLANESFETAGVAL